MVSLRKVVFGVVIGFMLSTSTVVFAATDGERYIDEEKYVLSEAIQFISSMVNEEVDPSYNIELPRILIPVPLLSPPSPILTPIPYPNIPLPPPPPPSKIE